jgi:hypothetical protein
LIAAFRLCSEVDVGIRGPEALLQFLASDHLARALEQHRQDIDRLALQLDPQAALA